MISPLYPEPIAGCKCSACHEAIGSDLDLSADFPPAGCQPFSVRYIYRNNFQVHTSCIVVNLHTQRYVYGVDVKPTPNSFRSGPCLNLTLLV